MQADNQQELWFVKRKHFLTIIGTGYGKFLEERHSLLAGKALHRCKQLTHLTTTTTTTTMSIHSPGFGRPLFASLDN